VSDDAHLVATVRSFHRTVTQRIGALDKDYLARDRPLGTARVLWEIGLDGTDVRDLRSRLDLDSGHLSRHLRALEADGLITLAPSAYDGRVRFARATARGREELEVLDGRSDELARSILAPLATGQRIRLADAMSEVERLLTATMVDVAPLDPAHPDAVTCLQAYLAELDRLFDDGFDASRSIPAEAEDLRPPHGVLLVARLHDRPVGCGAVKLHADAPAEVKRMWVAPDVRGLGLGRRLLRELEERARRAGSQVVRLETNRSLTAAVAMYRSAGYREVPPFNDEPYADHWFEKDLAVTTGGRVGGC
jgi:DNA-binding MarR family transcriptional regulator/ribosomal protein S18 acetylase RimI-like enzyme